MKKMIFALVMGSLLLSCGPKRMSCYGKRCVENSHKPQATKPAVVHT